MVSEGVPSHGPVHLLVASASEFGFQFGPLAMGWSRPGVLLLGNFAGPVDAWRAEVAADLCDRDGFWDGPLLDVFGSLQLLNSVHVTERDKALLRSVMVGGVLKWFLFG